MTFFGTAITLNSSERLLLRNLYFNKPNNYSCDRAAQGQPSKFTWRNTAASLRILEKSNYSPEHVLEKSWSEKCHEIRPQETVMKSFLVNSQPPTLLK